MRKFYLLFIAAALSLTSCYQPTPSEYEDDIVDFVKFELSLADAVVEECNDLESIILLFDEDIVALAQLELINKYDEFETYLLERWRDSITFEQLLEEEAFDSNSDYQEEAEVVLKKYRKQIVALSEYEELTEWDDMVEIWTFNEVRSGVEFIFTFDFDTYTWTIEPDEDSMEDYFSDRL